MGIEWPDQAMALFSVSVRDVLAFRDLHLAAAAAEIRLPISVPNPAHAQFISRQSTDPLLARLRQAAESGTL